MESAGLRVAERCANIRWKGMFIDVQPDPAGPTPETNERIFWCVHTQNCLGPDGQVVEEDTCNSLRSC